MEVCFALADAHLHASGGEVAGRAVLAVGASGSGKSSLALAWSRAGVPLLSDDIVLVDRRGWVRGIPRLLKVGRRPLRTRGLDDADTVAADPRVSALWWDLGTGGGGWSRGWRSPALVAHVSYEAGRRTDVEPLAPVEGLRVLLDHVMATGHDAAAALTALAAEASP